MLFEDLSLSKSIQKAIIDKGYAIPTPIQEQSIPLVLAGKDLIGTAQTGTGKTAAFAIPIIHQLHRIVGSSKKVKEIRALIITPTRELAIQIGESFNDYAKYTNLIPLTVFGGVSQNPQVDFLKKGVDILVATPGRLLDLHKQGFVNLDSLHTLVLDEADLMLDMGFVNDIKKIVKITPKNRQTLFFSATMPIEIRELAEMFLTNPETVSVSAVSSIADNLRQDIYFVEKSEKRNLLHHLIKNKNLSDLLVFSRTRHGADNIVKALIKNNITAEAIHGDKSQNARQRVLESFKNKEIDVLVATDIAARGIDIDQLTYVINFDLPNIPETYVHRVGRTARAGNEGLVISFCSKDEQQYWKDIQKLIKVDVKIITDHPYPWHTSIGTAEKSPNKLKNSNRSAGAHRSRKSSVSKQNKKRWY